MQFTILKIPLNTFECSICLCNTKDVRLKESFHMFNAKLSILTTEKCETHVNTNIFYFFFFSIYKNAKTSCISRDEWSKNWYVFITSWDDGCVTRILNLSGFWKKLGLFVNVTLCILWQIYKQFSFSYSFTNSTPVLLW